MMVFGDVHLLVVGGHDVSLLAHVEQSLAFIQVVLLSPTRLDRPNDHRTILVCFMSDLIVVRNDNALGFGSFQVGLVDHCVRIGHRGSSHRGTGEDRAAQRRDLVVGLLRVGVAVGDNIFVLDVVALERHLRAEIRLANLADF